MLGRRVTYLAVLLSSFVFYCFYKEWFSWLMLVAVGWLPIFGLLLSLPAMLTARVSFSAPAEVRTDLPARTVLDVRCPLPKPPVRCKIRLHNLLTDERFTGLPGEHVPTTHCGLVRVWCTRIWIYDYLGLFRIPVKQKPVCTVYVLPKTILDREPKPEEQQPVTNWRPKPGGGFAENHDLRPYRPGDDLRQIHWKISAKVGQLVYREALEPVQKDVLLCLTLSGDPDSLDRKLGRVLGLSRRLLEQGIAHNIRCTIKDELLHLPVTDRNSQEQALRTLLEGPATTGESVPENLDALWQCYIGGGPDEA